MCVNLKRIISSLKMHIYYIHTLNAEGTISSCIIAESFRRKKCIISQGRLLEPLIVDDWMSIGNVS